MEKKPLPEITVTYSTDDQLPENISTINPAPKTLKNPPIQFFPIIKWCV